MRDDDDMTAVRVRQLIQGRDLKDAEFAARVGLDPSKLSKSLTGARRFTSLELARIADRFQVTVDWLMGVEVPTAALAARVAEESALDSVELAQAAAARFAQRREDLASLGFGLDLLPERSTPLTGLHVNQGTALAEWAVSLVEQSGLSTTDRDLATTIEQVFNIDVAIEPLPDRFDGIAWRNNGCRLILVGTTLIPGRQRFSMAHELGHILAEDDQRLIRVEPSAGDFAGGGNIKLSEMRANAFAAAFLMPAKSLRERVSQPIDDETFCQLSCDFSVSPGSLGYRLMNLKMISDETRFSLSRLTTEQCAYKVGRSAELGEAVGFSRAARIPRTLVRDSFRAYLDGATTLRPYASLIGVDVDQLRASLEMQSMPMDSPQMTSFFDQ